MEEDEFKAQIGLLAEVWGANNYSAPVVKILWRGFQNTPGDQFRSAIENLVATRPARHAPPLLKEIDEACNEAKKRAAADRQSGGNASIYGTLQNAAREGKGSADPEFVAKCLEHLRKFLDGKIDRKVFDEGCKYLADVAKILDPKGSREPATAAVGLQRPARDRYADGGNND